MLRRFEVYFQLWKCDVTTDVVRWYDLVRQYAWDIYGFLVIQPLSMFYLDGPKVLGGWEGKEINEICAELTNTPSNFWSAHSEECWARISRSFHSWTVLVNVILYFAVGYKILLLLISCCNFRSK